jgi:predicted PurR-regulated permease PerM
MAIFVLVWGLVVVNLVDNIVRPWLVSKGAHIPAILAFLGALGGLVEWGWWASSSDLSSWRCATS